MCTSIYMYMNLLYVLFQPMHPYVFDYSLHSSSIISFDCICFSHNNLP